MRVIDRYISYSIISIFIATIIIFCILYILIDTTSTLDEIIDRKVSIDILIKYYLSFLPIIIVQTSSIACLIATLFTFSNLNNNNEIIALRSSGLNFWQITKPAIFISLLISVLILLINECYVPQASITTKQIRNENMILKSDRKRRKAEIKNMTFYGLNNRLYFIDSFNPVTHHLKGITIIGHNNEQEVKEKIVAWEGQWTGLAWKFSQCQITSFSNDGGINTPVKIKVYEEKLMDIKETPQDFLRQKLDVSSMNIKQLRNYISRFSNSGATRALNNLRVDLYQKFTYYPLGNFVIALLGMPFVLLIKGRGGNSFTSIGIAIGIGFFYYVINAVFLAFGKGGLLPPLLAAWAPPLIFIGIALILIENHFQ